MDIKNNFCIRTRYLHKIYYKIVCKEKSNL